MRVALNSLVTDEPVALGIPDQTGIMKHWKQEEVGKFSKRHLFI